MQTIIIKLSPGKLTNPEVSLCYAIPEEIEKFTEGKVLENGYEYLENDDMGIWLKTEAAEEMVPKIVDLFQQKKFLKNDLSQSAEIYISQKDNDELENCLQVYPK